MTDSARQQLARRGGLWRAGASLLGLAVVVIIMSGLPVVAGLVLKANLKTQYPPLGALVDIGGYRLHLYCQGSGSPTVVMETGLGDPGVMWELIRPEIAGVTRTCVYDRAGYGWSDVSPQPRTSENIVAELHTLLSNAQVEGPYVLVGHSFGGPLVRLYAHTYPANVAGMVLVDSSHEQQFARFPEALVSLQLQREQQAEQDANRDRPLVDLGLTALWGAINPPASPLPLAAAEAYESFFAADMKLRDAQVVESQSFRANLEQVGAAHITTLGDIPLIVLSRGLPTPPDALLSAEVAAQLDQSWQQMQTELAQLSPQGTLVLATESGHYIQLDQPELVIDAVKQVVAAAR